MFDKYKLTNEQSVILDVVLARLANRLDSLGYTLRQAESWTVGLAKGRESVAARFQHFGVLLIDRDEQGFESKPDDAWTRKWADADAPERRIMAIVSDTIWGLMVALTALEEWHNEQERGKSAKQTSARVIKIARQLDERSRRGKA